MSPSRLESEVEVGGFKFGYFESVQLNEPNNSVECLKRKSFRGQKLMVRPKHTIFTFRRHSLLRWPVENVRKHGSWETSFEDIEIQ